jgi:molybdopterin synthase sulfur carrier subunit
MMVTIEFLGPIGKEDMCIDIDNLSQLSMILKEDKQMSVWLENSAVAVNDTLVSSKDFQLKHGDKVSFLPPVCGG